MKMKNPIRARHVGTVTEIDVSGGQNVTAIADQND